MTGRSFLPFFELNRWTMRAASDSLRLMLVRALLLLFLVAGVSIALTYALGDEVLVALGLILVQLKVISKKLAQVELPAILVWLKTQTSAFFRVEILKRWAMTTAIPLIIGNAALRRLEKFLAAYRDAIRSRYDGMLAWYDGLEWYEKAVATLIVVFATLGLTVTSLGLWLLLFSVKLPFWAVAAATSLGRMIWTTITKTAFRTAAFLQLTWVWKALRRRLPPAYLERKRRFDFRVARMVVRRRRMTLKQLEERKDSLTMRLSLIREYFRQERPAPPTREELAEHRQRRRDSGV